MNLLTRPWCRSTSSTTTPKNRFSSSTTSAGSRSVASVVEPTMSTNSTETTRVSPPSSTSPSGGRLGDVAADVPAEEVAQLLAVAEPGDHLVEPGLELAELGAVVHLHLDVELALLDPLHRVAHGEDRGDDRAGVEPGDQQAEAEHHAAEDEHDDGQLGRGRCRRGSAPGSRRRRGRPRVRRCRAPRTAPSVVVRRDRGRCSRSSPDSARAATGRRANSLNRKAIPHDHQGGDADREGVVSARVGLEEQRPAA